MQKQIMCNGKRISYIKKIEKCEESKNELDVCTVFLHGWGSNKEAFSSLFSERKNYIALDFPAFGKSEDLTIPFTLADYAMHLDEFLEKISQKKIEFVVHSFGGRVLLKYLDMKSKKSEKISIENIICIGVPFYRNLSNMKKLQMKYLEKLQTQSLGKYIHSFLSSSVSVIKKILQKIIKREQSDYEALDSEIMKKTFQNIVNEDISVYLPVLKEYEKKLTLIWGENDEASPLEYAKNVHELYPKSLLFIIKNAGHFPWIDNKKQFLQCFTQNSKELNK